jgi:IS1 family transposase
MGINIYIMTMLSREPRQIVAYAVDTSAKADRIQTMVDGTVQVENYYTDGGTCYTGVDFIGCHQRNVHNKKDTHNIESSNADLRHYIAGLRRRSRCFFRSVETLEAVLYAFICAFNKFGEAKMLYRHRHPDRGRDVPFSLVDFI